MVIVMTNFEKMQKMDIEELAKFILNGKLVTQPK